MSRRRPTQAERDALQVWFELADQEAGAPMPQHIVDLARAICRLALARGLPAKQAAAHAATLAGLTGRAIADFRAEQDALLTEMAYEFHRSQPKPEKSTFVAATITRDVSARQVYKRLKRVR